MYTQHGFAVLQYHYTVRGEDARSATGTGSGRLLRCTTGGTALAPLPLVVSLASLRRYVEWNSKNAKLPALLQLRQARRTPSNTNSRSNGQSSNITHNNSVEDGAWMAAPHWGLQFARATPLAPSLPLNRQLPWLFRSFRPPMSGLLLREDK